MEPLIFSSISIPINMFKSFNIDNIYNLVETSYSQDFIKKKKKNSYETSIITLWNWFVKHGWSFANNLYILYLHIYYVDFLGECLFFIWVYLDKIYSSAPPQHKIPGSATGLFVIRPRYQSVFGVGRDWLFMINLNMLGIHMWIKSLIR